MYTDGAIHFTEREKKYIQRSTERERERERNTYREIYIETERTEKHIQ